MAKRIKKFKSCGNCQEGYIYKKNEETGELDYVERCDCWKEYQKTIILKHKLIKSNIPPSIISYNPNNDYVGDDKDNNLKAIDNYINKFLQFPKFHLYFYGSVGTQKSTLLRYIGKELLAKGFSVYYTLADDLIKELIKADRDEDMASKYKRITKDIDLLIIDEMSEDKITTYKSGWQRKFLLPFLKKRLEIYENNTLFASNSPYDNIGEFFEGAIQDIIHREVKAQLTFTDNYEKLSNSVDISKLWE